jgi:hypothetical protein
MLSYEKLYGMLFNGITDALSDIGEKDYHSAEDTLIRIQQQAEDYYVRAYEEDPDAPDYSVTVSPVIPIGEFREKRRDILKPNKGASDGRLL